MEVTFIAPTNEQFKIEYKDILSFSKMICEEWMEQSPEYQEKFAKFSENYHLFPPYYDFMLYRLKFIQVGFPLYPDCYGVPGISSMKIKKGSTSLDYDTLKKSLDKEVDIFYRGDDKNLGYKNCISDFEEGFLLRDGSFVTLKQLVSHRKLFDIYFLEQSIVEPTLCDDFLQVSYQLNDRIEYTYYCMGLAMLASKNPKYAIYDEHLMTEKQKDVLQHLDLNPEMDAQIREDFHNPYRQVDLQY